MSDDNKEGAGVPVAWLHYAAKKPQLRRVDFSPTPSTLEKASGWLSIALGPVATPPAVVPAAPSDAAMIALDDLEAMCKAGEDSGHSVMHIADVRSSIEGLRAALSQTMQPQASAIEWPDDAELEAWRSTADDLLRSLPNLHGAEIRRAAHLLQNAYLFASRAASAQQTEPAAGEQAGAVADEAAAWDFGLWLVKLMRLADDYHAASEPAKHRFRRSLYDHARNARMHWRAHERLDALAAPGAAIAAREQEGES